MHLEHSDLPGELETSAGQAWRERTQRLRNARRARPRGWQTTPRHLVERARLLDPHAVSSLCGAYRLSVRNFLRQRGASRDLAEDVTQGFFEGLLKRGDFSKIEPESSLRAWLRVGALHQLFNERRKEKTQTRWCDERKTAEMQILAEERRSASCERLLDQRRALRLIDRAWTRLRVEYSRVGSEVLFEHLKRSLSREKTELTDAALCQRLGYSDSYVAVARLRLKDQEFPAALLAELKADRKPDPERPRPTKATSIREELRALLDAVA
jgi:DNA-directed RNA polymerase specialized sigma24 family protein